MASASTKETTKGFLFEDKAKVVIIPRTNYILGIGINDYEVCPKLNNAVKDVQDFIHLMTQSFDFKSENVTVLFDEEATRDNILQTLDDLASKLTDTDNLIIYFSGHGEYKKSQNNGYWIPVNAEQKHSQYISNSDIKDHLNVIKAHHIFLISDACFSGSLFRSSQGKNVTTYYDKYASRWGLTSGRGIVPDGKPGTNSPFAKELLKHLRRTATDKKAIGVQTLCAAVTDTVAPNGEQLPTGQPLMVKGHDLGQFVFTPKGTVPQLVKENTTPSINTSNTNRGGTKPAGKESIFKNKNLRIGTGIFAVIVLVWIVKGILTPEPVKEQPIIIKDITEPVMISVKGAIYEMGSLDGEADETPQTVTVNDFEIGETEVTNRTYVAFLNDRGNQNYIAEAKSAIKALDNNQFGVYAEDLDKPVVAVTYKGAEHYTKWLSEKTGKNYSLPTEAEWELAAAGGKSEKTRYAGGNDTFENIMWYNENSGDSLHTVKTSKPNVLGIYDMSGNVSEWCSDDYAVGEKVIRGGSYKDPKDNCRITNRNGYKPNGSAKVIGFRLVKE